MSERNNHQNSKLAESTLDRADSLYSSDGSGNSVPRLAGAIKEIADAIENYRLGNDINGQSPEEFLNNLQVGWTEAGFTDYNSLNPASRDSLVARGLLGELSIMDIAASMNTSVSQVDKYLDADPSLIYYEYMNPDQQSAFDHHWGTNDQKFALSAIKIQRQTANGLQKQKDKEWIEIMTAIEANLASPSGLDENGSADPLACQRHFYHEDGVGTTGYVPRHTMFIGPYDSAGRRISCTQRTFRQGGSAVSQQLLPQPQLFNKYKWIASAALTAGLYKEKAKIIKGELPEGTVKFSEQCFLIDNMEYMENNPHRYNNFVQVDGGDPKDFLNKLIAKQNMQNFVNATPEELSNLVPYIKLWKVLYPDQKSKGQEIQLKFKNSLGKDIDKIMNSSYGRGDAVGIKSFEWNLAGTNAVEASRLIESRLVLYFQDINALESSSTGKASFLDLIYRNPKHVAREGKGEDCGPVKIWNEKYYRMKIQVGWSGTGKLSRLDLKKTFFLTLIDHQINFRDNGTIELSLRLQSQIEGLLASPNSDILLMDRNQHLVKLQNELDCYIAGVAERGKKEKKKGTKISKSKIEKREKDRKEKVENLKNQIKAERDMNYRAFLEKVEAKRSLHFVDIPMSDVRNWNYLYVDEDVTGVWEKHKLGEFLNKRKIYNSGEGGSALDRYKDKKSYEKARQQAEEKGKEFIPTATAQYITKGGGLGGAYNFVAGGNVRLHYVHLGAILEAALSVHNENDEVLAELRNIIGNIELKRGDAFESSPQIFSLADIPVSLKQFTNWYYDECISRDKAGWNLSAFLKSLTSFIVKTVKSDCLIGSRTTVGRPRVELRPLSLSLYSNGACRMTGMGRTKNKNSARAFNATSKKINGKVPYDDAWRAGHNLTNPNDGISISSNQFGSYLVLSVYNISRSGRLSKPLKGQTRRARDAKWGIYHFKIGMDRGLLKNINFKKMDDPMLEAARYIEEGDTLGGLVRRYNATVDMYGNNLFQPGSEIFLDTSRGKDVNSISHKLGLGGYYMVRSVNSSIGLGEFTTSLDCIFISSGEEKDKEADPVARLTTGAAAVQPRPVSDSGGVQNEETGEVQAGPVDRSILYNEETNEVMEGPM